MHKKVEKEIISLVSGTHMELKLVFVYELRQLLNIILFETFFAAEDVFIQFASQ